SVTPPEHMVVRIIDSNGVDMPNSPFDVTPGVPKAIDAGVLQPGDYEFHITNPTLTNGYSITVPPGVPFVSVDGYGLGNVWLSSYRAYFDVPAGQAPVGFAATPSG